jgi:hypothetical protein
MTLLDELRAADNRVARWWDDHAVRDYASVASTSGIPPPAIRTSTSRSFLQHRNQTSASLSPFNRTHKLLDCFPSLAAGRSTNQPIMYVNTNEGIGSASFIGDQKRGGWAFYRGHSRGVHAVKILPAEWDTRWCGGGDCGPGFVFEWGRALPVHLNQHRNLFAVKVHGAFGPDHGELELVQDQEFLRQVLGLYEVGEPGDNRVDFVRIDSPYLLKR